jgi:hypothetical protein
LHGFLAGIGPDHHGRHIGAVLSFSDREIESIHDFIQWLFPLPEPSRAQPSAPVLSEQEIAAIRADAAAQAGLLAGRDRMLAFYRESRGWLCQSDHNHLRITRIIRSLRLLHGEEDAHAFYDAVMRWQADAGAPVAPGNLAFWHAALTD